ncbi:CLUMA_CG010938, isoform A [Clunio marinus]|uniref:CLUMA_CG010938, isoform A n=1 Tax=Clunio marinus TaxID=568069 RepID=A0A1J1IBE3_9DIPT|nr:CLUMA_CG010938, isoform A [Clunio marinus]
MLCDFTLHQKFVRDVCFVSICMLCLFLMLYAFNNRIKEIFIAIFIKITETIGTFVRNDNQQFQLLCCPFGIRESREHFMMCTVSYLLSK